MGLVVAGGMILIALFLLRSEWEKLQLGTVRQEIRTKKQVSGSAADRDSTGRLRLLFISDLHDYLPARHMPEKILNAIDEAKPDAILVGGDFLTVPKSGKKPEPDTRTALALLEKIAGKYPVYCGEGNHESRLKLKNPEAYAEYVCSLLNLGVRYLADTTTPLLIGGPDGERDCGTDVTGISLEEEYYCSDPGFGLKKRLPEGYLREKMGTLQPDRFQILLLHHPGFLPEAAAENVDLVLSGHMHGGTVRLPDGSGLMTPQYRLFVKECSGRFEMENTVMLVNRGIGTHSIKIRFNDLPELTVIDIVNENIYSKPSENAGGETEQQ